MGRGECTCRSGNEELSPVHCFHLRSPLWLLEPVSYRSYEAPGGDLDYWLILRPHLADVVAGFVRLSGHIAFGPRWSLGCGSSYPEEGCAAMSVLHDPPLERLLAKLHEESDAQTQEIREHYDRAADRPSENQAARTKAFLSDKLFALDRDKAEFCYQLCRAIDARRIVEIGTSYGVSTLYLAAAVRDNVRAGGGSGGVIGTEHEPK